MKKISFLFAAITLLGLSSCSPTLSPFTQRLYEENDWSESELKRVQFYLSKDIVLRRQASKASSQIEEGAIKIRNGQKVEEVVIRSGTPGVLVYMPKENRFGVSFEDGDKFLMFGPNPKAGDKYVLLASDWKDRQGKVSYGDGKYWVDANNGIASLMVDLRRVRNTSVKSRTAGGRRVGG